MATFRSLLNKLYNVASGLPKNFIIDKKRIIDFTFGSSHHSPKSFADLGGIWNVDGAYTFYTLAKYKIESAYIIDTDFTETALNKSRNMANLKMIKGNFGDESIADKIGTVDVIFLFDVLLHQVKPDWNEIIKNYSKRTDCFVVFNQQWTGSEDTVRLLDLGRDEYFRNVPHSKEDPGYKVLFDKIDEMHPQHKKPWRDMEC